VRMAAETVTRGGARATLSGATKIAVLPVRGLNPKRPACHPAKSAPAKTPGGKERVDQPIQCRKRRALAADPAGSWLCAGARPGTKKFQKTSTLGQKHRKLGLHEPSSGSGKAYVEGAAKMQRSVHCRDTGKECRRADQVAGFRESCRPKADSGVSVTRVVYLGHVHSPAFLSSVTQDMAKPYRSCRRRARSGFAANLRCERWLSSQSDHCQPDRGMLGSESQTAGNFLPVACPSVISSCTSVSFIARIKVARLLGSAVRRNGLEFLIAIRVRSGCRDLPIWTIPVPGVQPPQKPRRSHEQHARAQRE